MSIMNSGRARGRIARRVALSITTILVTGLAAPAWAQSPHPNLDANGIDLTTGQFDPRLPVASVGSGQAELSVIAYDGQRDNWSDMRLTVTTSGGVNSYQVGLGGRYDNFANASTTSTRGTGATLTVDFANATATYRTLDGVEVVFGNPSVTYYGDSNLCNINNTANCTLLPASATGLSGLTVNFTWDTHASCTDVIIEGDSGPDCVYDWRMASVSNEAGYSINWNYAAGSSGNSSSPSPTVPGPDWFRRTTAVLKNGATTTGTITYTKVSPSVYTITTPGGSVWRYTNGNAQIRRPTASSDTTTVVTSGSNKTVTRDGIVTTYSRSSSGSTATMVVTDAQSNSTTIVSDMNKVRPTAVTDALSRTTYYAWDSTGGRITEITFPEGNKIQYSYDSRGNPTETRLKPKTGSGDIVTTAIYPSSCSTPSCNSPDSTTDALGNVTNYSYDGTTGLLTAVTRPAATGGTKRPETRQSYTANGAGIYLLTGLSTCQTGATTDTPSCVGIADEVKTTSTWDGNLNTTSVTTAAGDASLSAVTGMTYSSAGDVLTVDGPLSGNSDTTYFRYDADRRRIGVISPDPDGGGSLKMRAQRTTYNADGQTTLVETGTVNGTSGSDWAAFASAQQLTITYDTNARKTKEVLTANGTTYQVTQYSYDSVGRLECVALRMNPSTWSSLPSSACTLATTGSAGPDRITKYTYNAVSQVTKVQTGYGVSGVQADEVTTTYTNNGLPQTVADAEGNKTTYEYDVYDRPSKTRFPSTSKGAGTSSTTDYTQFVYDANSNVTSIRLRGYSADSTQHIDFTFDYLGRITAKDRPGSELDVTYTYDLLGRRTGASQTGVALTFAYDALSRNTSQGGPLGTVSFQYDAAGRRTRTIWPDSFYVSYDRLVTGEVTVIRENGAGSGVGVLATYAYDNLGRRTSLTRSNGTVTTYGVDDVSRLTSLAQNLDGTTDDVTTSFTYNPASAIASQTRTNDLYAWGGHFNVARDYDSNGLNQLTASGGTGLTYDARGNLTGAGSDSYGYSSENLLTSATVGGVSLTYNYDPANRLFKEAGGSVARFIYDGSNMIAETNNSGVLQKRYVFGPGTDEVLVEYAGSGTGSNVRTFLHADERGSIIARSNESGVKSAINGYDEYGIPASTNTGRFQYTGQTWLPQLGMYYYKARIYSPTLGRFMQPDPIGYGGGANIYAYVGNDPANFRDPSGKYAVCMDGTKIATNAATGDGDPCADHGGIDYLGNDSDGGFGRNNSGNAGVNPRDGYAGFPNEPGGGSGGPGNSDDDEPKPCTGVIRIGLDGSTAVGGGATAGGALNVDLGTGKASTERYFGGMVGISANAGAGVTGGDITVATSASTYNKRSIVVGGSYLGFGASVEFTGTLFNPSVDFTYGASYAPGPKAGFTAAYQAVRRHDAPVTIPPAMLAALRATFCSDGN